MQLSINAGIRVGISCWYLVKACICNKNTLAKKKRNYTNSYLVTSVNFKYKRQCCFDSRGCCVLVGIQKYTHSFGLFGGTFFSLTLLRQDLLSAILETINKNYNIGNV